MIDAAQPSKAAQMKVRGSIAQNSHGDAIKLDFADRKEELLALVTGRRDNGPNRLIQKGFFWCPLGAFGRQGHWSFPFKCLARDFPAYQSVSISRYNRPRVSEFPVARHLWWSGALPGRSPLLIGLLDQQAFLLGIVTF